VERLIQEQLRIMEKQLQLMRTIEAAERGTAPVAAKHLVADNGRPRAAVSPATVGSGTADGRADAAAEAGGLVETLPLTDLQTDVWVNCQLSDAGSAAYDLSNMLSLRGDLDVGALHEALRRLVGRHESLRTTFDPTGDHQVIHPVVDVDLPLVDLSGRSEAEREQALATFMDSQVTMPYDLVEGPLFRATLIRCERDHLLVLSGHHLVCDGWSFSVMKRELGVLYTNLVTAHKHPVGKDVL
jgi:hypothetical protein